MSMIASSFLNIVVQNFDMNFESLFEIIPSDNPQSAMNRQSSRALA